MKVVIKGTYRQWQYYEKILREKLPNLDVQLGTVEGGTEPPFFYHCVLKGKPEEYFKAGMILAQCNYKFQEINCEITDQI